MLSLAFLSEKEQEYYKAHGLTVKDGILYVHLNHQCPHLTKENLCDIYDERPQICREFPNKNNPVLPGGCIWPS